MVELEENCWYIVTIPSKSEFNFPKKEKSIYSMSNIAEKCFKEWRKQFFKFTIIQNFMLIFI